jgi:hypothetical protein
MELLCSKTALAGVINRFLSMFAGTYKCKDVIDGRVEQ